MDYLNHILGQKRYDRFKHGASAYARRGMPSNPPKQIFVNKRVDGAFELPVKTAVIVPSTRNLPHKKGVPISPADMKRRVTATRKRLSKFYGGYTSVESVGGYVYRRGNSKGRVATEGGVVVTAYATREKFLKHKQAWLNWVRARRDSWKQESMGIIIEDKMLYI